MKKKITEIKEVIRAHKMDIIVTGIGIGSLVVVYQLGKRDGYLQADAAWSEKMLIAFVNAIPEE